MIAKRRRWTDCLRRGRVFFLAAQTAVLLRRPRQLYQRACTLHDLATNVAVMTPRRRWTVTKVSVVPRMCSSYCLVLCPLFQTYPSASDGNKTQMLRPRPLKQQHQQDCRCTYPLVSYLSACANRYVLQNRWFIDWLLEHFFNLIMYLTYFIRPPLCTAPGTQCWKQNQNVKTNTKTETGLRPALS